MKIDGHGDKEFRNKLKQYLSQHLKMGAIKKFSFVDSKRDNLVQLADMVVGAIARSYTRHKDGNHWVKMLKRRIDDILELNRPRNLV